AISDVAAPGTAKALAQRAASYAQTVQPFVAKHTLYSPDHGDWPDPDSMKLTAQQPITDSPPAARPAEANTALALNTPSPAERQVKPVVASSVHEVQPAAPAAVPADALAAKLAKRAKDYPTDVAAQIDNQLMKFLHDEPVPDMQSLAGLSPEDRELLSALTDSLTNFRNGLRADNNMLFSKKIAPLIDLGDRLRSMAELSVPIVTLVSKAPAYGVYEPIDPARFVADKEHLVGVYYEVENFSTQPNEKKLYETRLSEEMVLYTESSGLPVWSEKKTTYTDVSHRHRRDFFVAKRITLPKTLTIGRYLLKVTVEDLQARRIAENTTPIEIVAQ
ncbi:MAG TPA: hypothetical protein VN541_02235, partial [Tepidisphaeraceae bacterium]|nr:hypothetical protein [Tepidisphaeraceae bacterium]